MLQFQALRGPSKRHLLELFAVYVESHRAAIHTEREVCPLANKRRQVEAGARAGLAGIVFRVEQ